MSFEKENFKYISEKYLADYYNLRMPEAKCCVSHGNVNIACHIACIRPNEFWIEILPDVGYFWHFF